MMSKYVIDKEKNIGDVVFIVEGGRPEFSGTELRLLKRIFSDILGYEVQELCRGCEEFIGHGSNPFSRVFALNLPKNQLTQLTDETLDTLFHRLRSEFKLKPEDCPIYFLYDRDYLSYKPNELRSKYVTKYTDPYGNENGDQGQLLLSYPAVESYMLSCVQDDVYRQEGYLGTDVKPVLKSIGFSEQKVSTEAHLIHAAEEMNKGLSHFGFNEYDLDNLAPILLGVYDGQQEKVRSEKNFNLLSLISMALLELGVIKENDNDV